MKSIKKEYPGRIEYRNGSGKFHREDGPAEIWDNGAKFWWLNGLQHRIDGPASIYQDGTECWYLNGKSHRIGGPSSIHPDGTKYWYLDGKLYINEEDYKKELNKLKQEFLDIF